MQRNIVDFAVIPERQHAIHERLDGWARWVSVRPNGWQTHPMWRKSITSRQWEASPHIPLPLNTLDAMALEKAISKLPIPNRDSLRWYYVRKGDVLGMCRHLGMSKQGLFNCVTDGRTMLMNVVG